MIDPFEPGNLKPASYELTVGYEYSIGGEIKTLLDERGKNIIEIPPFEVVIIRTKEIINLPRFIIARWNIRVKKAYEGLLWVGGPQVDPGWVGYLSCPLYNLSHKPVCLELYEPIAVIDFVKTTPFNKRACVEYQLKKGESNPKRQLPSRILFEDYKPEKLESALFNEAKNRIDEVVNNSEKGINEMKNKIGRIESLLYTFSGSIIAVLAIVVTTLSIFVSSGSANAALLPYWYYISMGFSLIALIISLYTISKSNKTK